MKRVLPILFAVVCCTLLFASASQAQQSLLDVTSAVPAASTVQTLPGGMQPLSQWSTGTNIPSARGYLDGTCVSNTIYVFGGLTAAGIEKTAFKFDITSGAWTPISMMPKGRSLPMVENVGGKVYIVGGFSSTSPFTTEATVLEFDPTTSTYTEKAGAATPVFGGAAVVNNGRIWVLGGGTTSYQAQTAAIQIFDPAQNTWTTSSSLMPRPVRANAAVCVGDKIYMVGGYAVVSGSGVFYPEFYIGTISGDAITWEKQTDFPGGSIMRASMGTDGTKIYLTGGYDITTNSTGVPAVATWNFDPTSKTWTSMEPKLTGVYYATQMINDANGKFYVVGGTITGGGYTGTLDILDPGAATTSKITVNRTSISDWLKVGATKKFSLSIKNSGGLALTWNASSNAAWLTTSKASGSVDPTKTDKIDIVLNATGMAPDVKIGYAGTITLTSNDPTTPSLSVNVSMFVQNEVPDEPINILLEEGTGTWCGYCPYGVDSLKAIIARYPDIINVISYHQGDVLETPSRKFWTDLSGLTGYPNGSINRVVFEGNTAMCMSRGEWDSRIVEVLNTMTSPINIKLANSTYSAATKDMSLTFDITFHRTVDGPLRLVVAQLQDGQIYRQTYYPASGGTTYLPTFEHNHVMRQAIPNDAGEVISDGSKAIETQSKVTKTFNFKSLDSTINTSRFVVYVHRSNGTTFGEVLQSVDIPLASIVTDVHALPTNASFALSQNYPNPFNPTTTISYDVPVRSSVTLVVTDNLGREVARPVDGVEEAGRHSFTFDATSLTSGTYFLTMRAGSYVQTRTMTLVK